MKKKKGKTKEEKKKKKEGRTLVTRMLFQGPPGGNDEKLFRTSGGRNPSRTSTGLGKFVLVCPLRSPKRQSRLKGGWHGKTPPHAGPLNCLSAVKNYTQKTAIVQNTVILWKQIKTVPLCCKIILLM